MLCNFIINIATQKSLSAVARYWNNKEAKVQDMFLNLLEVQDSTSKGLFDLIKTNILNKYKIPYRNIIGFSADNASVMIYSYFAHSSKRIEELKNCQIFAAKKPKKMLYPSKVRRLSLRVSVLIIP